MLFLYKNISRLILICTYITYSIIATANAIEIPGSADSSRIDVPDSILHDESKTNKTIAPQTRANETHFKDDNHPSFHLKKINLKGVTALKVSELANIYNPFIGKEVKTNVLWKISDAITKKYTEKGYFLSRAYVPAQEIEKGIVTIQVVEGYLEKVEIDDQIAKNPLVKKLISRIKSEKPLNSDSLESFMLKINELPGLKFQALLEPLKESEPGAVKLSLKADKKGHSSSVSFDNFSSKFMGPYQGKFVYQDSIIPNQTTQLSLQSSIPTKKLKAASLVHEIPIAPDWNLELSGSYINAKPGFTLKPNEIRSKTSELGFSINYQPIRQRTKNLLLSLKLQGKNSNTNISVDTPLTRDRVRVMRGNAKFDNADRFGGYNFFDFNLNQGLNILSSSKAGDSNISRTGAKPNFLTMGIDYSRQQKISANWLTILKMSGQLASKPLFSSEEFGYGGQNFGKAYDPSEITGDNGAAGGIELGYYGIKSRNNFLITPYSFYDIGKVWNKNSNSVKKSASSIGFGTRINHAKGLSTNFGAAWPLRKSIDNPMYGNGKNPRFYIQISYGF